MLQFELITYRPEQRYKGAHFFILNKGLNSGKPLIISCPNCFVCIVKSEAEKEELYWLIFGLWQGRIFRPNIIGSAIPYIRKKEIQEVITFGILKLSNNPVKAKKNISAITQLEESQLNILKQMRLMNELKKALIFEILK